MWQKNMYFFTGIHPSFIQNNQISLQFLSMTEPHARKTLAEIRNSQQSPQHTAILILLPTENTQHKIQHKKRAQNDQTNKVDPRRLPANGVIHLQGPKQDG